MKKIFVVLSLVLSGSAIASGGGNGGGNGGGPGGGPSVEMSHEIHCAYNHEGRRYTGTHITDNDVDADFWISVCDKSGGVSTHITSERNGSGSGGSSGGSGGAGGNAGGSGGAGGSGSGGAAWHTVTCRTSNGYISQSTNSPGHARLWLRDCAIAGGSSTHHVASGAGN